MTSQHDLWQALLDQAGETRVDLDNEIGPLFNIEASLVVDPAQLGVIPSGVGEFTQHLVVSGNLA